MLLLSRHFFLVPQERREAGAAGAGGVAVSDFGGLEDQAVVRQDGVFFIVRSEHLWRMTRLKKLVRRERAASGLHQYEAG